MLDSVINHVRRMEIAFPFDLSVKLTPEFEGVEGVIAALDRISRIMERYGDELALLGMKVIQDRVMKRARSRFPTPYETWAPWRGTRVTKESHALRAGFELVLNLLEPVVTGPHTAGMGPRTALDSIRLDAIRGGGLGEMVAAAGGSDDDTDEDVSAAEFHAKPSYGTAADISDKAVKDFYEGRESGHKYFATQTDLDIVWMIVEYGTGVYADESTKRTEGPTKAPGRGGAWYLNPGKKLPLIIGQKPTHFLFEERQAGVELTDDFEAAVNAISARVNEILYGTK